MRRLPFVSVLIPCVALACLAALVPPAGADAVAEPRPLHEAAKDLTTLETYLKDRKAINDQINQYLIEVAGAYVNMQVPEAPAADASEDEKAAHEGVMKKFHKELENFRKRANKALLKAFGLTRVKKGTNQRDDVNARAAEMIGSLVKAYPGPEGAKARGTISKKLRSAAEKLKKVKHDLNTDTLNAAFLALGNLGDLDTLRWMLDEYSHAKEVEDDWLIAAHTAMVRFPVTPEQADKTGTAMVPGKLRFEIVDSFVTTYAGVEAAANTSSNDPKDRAKKRFWDNIKNTTLPVLQHFSRAPKDPESGEALATAGEFQSWLRKNKNLRKAPWADPKKSAKKGKK